jgi:hypothetical protein
MTGTAHLMEGVERRGYRTVRVNHAALDQPVTLSGRGPLRGTVRHAGGSICGEPRQRLSDVPSGLFDAELTCGLCYQLCRTEAVEIQGAL